jgi:two-component system chemotaxis response regulator CheB
LINDNKYRVMVVDDSVVVRGMTTRILETDKDINVVASVQNGEVALKTLDRYDVDVVVLDIEMPVMDGMTALPLLLKKNPNLQVIMSSTLTSKNAEISLRALRNGAADYIAKPSSSRDFSKDDFQRELILKVKSLTKRKISRLDTKVGTPAKKFGYRTQDTGPITYRNPSKFKPYVWAIGSSTGGPQALFELFKGLKGVQINQPIFITQHMPATFTKILSQHLSNVSGRDVKEAEDGDLVQGGKVYIAKGGLHMTIKKQGANNVIKLVDAPPENFCKPSVEPMLRSILDIYGERTLVTILTGMGADGREGSEAIADIGGTVIAQDEKSSVVWGMPGAVAKAGVCSAIMPLTSIANYVKKFLERGGNVS